MHFPQVSVITKGRAVTLPHISFPFLCQVSTKALSVTNIEKINNIRRLVRAIRCQEPAKNEVFSSMEIRGYRRAFPSCPWHFLYFTPKARKFLRYFGPCRAFPPCSWHLENKGESSSIISPDELCILCVKSDQKRVISEVKT